MNDQNNTQNTRTEHTASATINSGELPPALQQRVLRQYGGAALVAAFSVLSIIMMNSWEFLIGFLISAYLAWLGYSLVRKWRNGLIVCKQVVCLKAQKLPLTKNKLIVVLKDLNAQAGDEKSVHNFYVPTSSKAAAQFSERAVLNIYIETENAVELLAWQVVDVAQ